MPCRRVSRPRGCQEAFKPIYLCSEVMNVLFSLVCRGLRYFKRP